MTYEEFKQLHPVVLKRLEDLKLKSGSQARSEISHHKYHRSDYNSEKQFALYYKAVIAEKEHLMDFTPPPERKVVSEPKPKIRIKPEPELKPEPEPELKPKVRVRSELESNITPELELTVSKSRVHTDANEEG